MTEKYIGIYLNCPKCKSKNITNEPWGIDLLVGTCNDCNNIFYNGRPTIRGVYFT